MLKNGSPIHGARVAVNRHSFFTSRSSSGTHHFISGTAVVINVSG